MYEIDRAVTEALADWVRIGVRVRSKHTQTRGTILGINIYKSLDTSIKRGREEEFSIVVQFEGRDYYSPVSLEDIEPIPSWKPKEGETVVCWDNANPTGRVSLRVYASGHKCYTSYRKKMTWCWDNIAQIPDNWKDEGYPLSIDWWNNQELYNEN